TRSPAARPTDGGASSGSAWARATARRRVSSAEAHFGSSPSETGRVRLVLADAVQRGLVSVLVALDLAARWARGDVRSVGALLEGSMPALAIESLLAAHPADGVPMDADPHTGEHAVVPRRVTARGTGPPPPPAPEEQGASQDAAPTQEEASGAPSG